MKKSLRALLILLLIASIFPKSSLAAQDESFTEDLQAYLAEISEIRGFEVTQDAVEMALLFMDHELADFNSVAELSEALGEVIKTDYSNLNSILEKYEFTTVEDINVLLGEYGESIDDYVFVNDLDLSVEFYIMLSEEDFGYIDEEYINELLFIFEEEFGLTEAEVQALTDHLNSLEEKLSSPETLEKVEALAERMAEIAYFETLDDLTPDQITELLSIYNEFLEILELKVEFSLIKSNEESEITILDLMNMAELTNAKLNINIYALTGTLLADLVVTGEMVDSDTVNEIGEEVDQATEDAAEEVAKATQSPAQVKTVKGGKLPNTAGNYATNALLGLMMLSLGVFVYRTNRKVS